MQYRATIASAIAVGIIPAQASLVQIKDRASTRTTSRRFDSLEQKSIVRLYADRTTTPDPLGCLYQNDPYLDCEDKKVVLEEVYEVKYQSE